MAIGIVERITDITFVIGIFVTKAYVALAIV